MLQITVRIKVIITSGFILSSLKLSQERIFLRFEKNFKFRAGKHGLYAIIIETIHRILKFFDSFLIYLHHHEMSLLCSFFAYYLHKILAHEFITVLQQVSLWLVPSQNIVRYCICVSFLFLIMYLMTNIDWAWHCWCWCVFFDVYIVGQWKTVL